MRSAPSSTRLFTIVVAAALVGLGSGAARAQGGASATQPVAAQTEGATTSADPLASARAECKGGKPCAHFATLARWSQDPVRGPEASTLLGETGDPRAAQLLALTMTHGVSAALRQAAGAALNKLVARTAEARAATLRISQGDPDPEVRAAAARVLAASAAASRDPKGVGATAEARAHKRGLSADTRASDPGRVVYNQTALSAPKGSVHWTAHNLILHSVDYAISDHLELGMSLLVPIGFYGFLPRVRVTHSISDMIHLGFIATGGIVGTYIEDGEEIIVYGGGPVVTFGDEELFFNLSVLGGGLITLQTEVEYDPALAPANPSQPEPGAPSPFRESTKAEHHWGMTPSVGVSWRFSRSARANLEVLALLGDHDNNGQIWAILYGIRIFGDAIYGDISFVIPIFEDADEILKYAWIGLPLLSIGYQWQ